MEMRSPKSVREDYSPSPFCFRQTSQSGQVRIVAWTGSQSGQRASFRALIERLPEKLDVLLKVRLGEADGTDGEDSDTWRRYHGVVERAELLDAMTSCETFVFCDSRNQLCVRDLATSDYVVLDDVGVIYIYSDEDLFPDVLRQHGFEERFERLISDGGYWGQTPKEGAAQGEAFRKMLHLVEIFRSSDGSPAGIH